MIGTPSFHTSNRRRIMYGLPPDIDLCFFAGRELQQVCIGQYQAILHFDNEIWVSIESDLGHRNAQGVITAVYQTITPAAAMLVAFLHFRISKATSEPPGTLILEFSNGEALEIYDSQEHYESYHFSSPEGLIVV